MYIQFVFIIKAGDNTVKGKIAKLGQNQAVYRIKSILGKTKVASPF
jgi:hypothetical protein